MATDERSAYISLQANSKVMFAAWPTSWRLPGVDRLQSDDPSELSHIVLRRN